MTWFKVVAPISLKLLLSYGLLVSLIAVVGVAGALFGGSSAIFLTVAVLCTVGGAAMGLFFREAIAGPYVTTVVRLEALAASDLASPIQFTEYRDCVGRMARAMFTFRDAATKQIQLTAEADVSVTVVESLSANIARVADGDLTADITSAYPATHEQLKASFNGALTSLRALVRGITDTAANIRTGSHEIAQASEDLARRTEVNAASLEQTSAALVQIDTRLKDTALSSGQTVARADQAIATVGGGRATAEEAVTAMERVSDSAKGIDSVIEGLDKIAFQTRVLAMNAAVEAGRAGDAGRGFAVVADLVSALAMRAEEEAKRARDQLTLTQTDIVTAVQAVRKVDGALANISGDVDEVHKLLGAMAQDATAQSATITQISAAIGVMDQSIQQNAAMVEETSAAARNLTAEVNSLAEQTELFKTEAAPPARRASPAPVAVAPVKQHRKSVPAYRSPVTALSSRATVTSGGSDEWNAF